MHSSRMRTGRLLTVCQNMLPGGVLSPRGVLLSPWGVLSPGGVWSEGVCLVQGGSGPGRSSPGVSGLGGVWSRGVSGLGE